MNPQLKTLQNWFGANVALIQGAAAPLLVVAILGAGAMIMVGLMILAGAINGQA